MMLTVGSVLTIICSLSLTCASDSPKVTVAQGTLVGTTVNTRGGREIFAFLGIPYAAPPIGQLRFKSPQPPSPWKGEQNATKEGNTCLQQFVLIEKLRNTITGHEDCLYLNVFTPKISQTERLPVMFYIHGGGYVGGSKAMSDYGPELLLDRDVVLVTINYRLGPLGFLSTGDKVLPGNLGLKDQLAALRWVQENIEQFGGDRNSVTLFGESSGGSSVHLHMLSPRSKGLFHAAISQSGTALCPFAFSSRDRHVALASTLARLVQCTYQSSQQLLECLMKLPAMEIVEKLRHFIEWDMDPVVLFNPAIEQEEVEDAFLTADPWTLTSDVPWMVGINENEGAMKAASLTQGNVQDKFKRFNDDFKAILPMSLFYQQTAKDPDKVTEAIRNFYFGGPGEITVEMVPQIINMYTDAWFMQGTMDAALRHSGPVFVYYFAYNSSFSLCSLFFNNPEYMGVCHLDELRYLFPMGGHAPKLETDDADYVMSSKMVELWTNYAKSKTPMLDSTKELWLSKRGSAEDYLLISKDGFTLEKDLLADRYQFWKNLPFREKPLVDRQYMSDEL